MTEHHRQPAPLLRATMLLTIGLLLSLALTTWSLIAIRNQNTAGLHHILTLQHDALINNCDRLNIKQRADNRNQLADFVYDRMFLKLVQASPAPRTAAKRRELTEFLGPLRAAVAAKAWVPIVADCRATIDRRGGTYRAPRAVPFSKRAPPPSAL